MHARRSGREAPHGAGPWAARNRAADVLGDGHETRREIATRPAVAEVRGGQGSLFPRRLVVQKEGERPPCAGATPQVVITSHWIGHGRPPSAGAGRYAAAGGSPNGRAFASYRRLCPRPLLVPSARPGPVRVALFPAAARCHGSCTGGCPWPPPFSCRAARSREREPVTGFVPKVPNVVFNCGASRRELHRGVKRALVAERIHRGRP